MLADLWPTERLLIDRFPDFRIILTAEKTFEQDWITVGTEETFRELRKLGNV